MVDRPKAEVDPRLTRGLVTAACSVSLHQPLFTGDDGDKRAEGVASTFRGIDGANGQPATARPGGVEKDPCSAGAIHGDEIGAAVAVEVADSEPATDADPSSEIAGLVSRVFET